TTRAERIDGGQCRPDAPVVHDLSITDRDVEVLAQQHAFPGDVDVVDPDLAHALQPRRPLTAERRCAARGRRRDTSTPTHCRTRPAPSPCGPPGAWCWGRRRWRSGCP